MCAWFKVTTLSYHPPRGVVGVVSYMGGGGWVAGGYHGLL